VAYKKRKNRKDKCARGDKAMRKKKEGGEGVNKSGKIGGRNAPLIGRKP